MMLRLKATCLAQMFCKRERREEVGEYGLEYAKRAASRLSDITGIQVAIMLSVRYHNAGPSGRAPSGGHSLSRRV
jgi:hypothetical protein